MTTEPSNAEAAGEVDVFISYSHADSPLAERLSRRIRRYRPPRALGLGRRRLTVFRDVERLTAQAELSEALLERVDSARNLLLMCSPAAAQSKYVDQEVAAFIARKDRDAVHIVLANGAPEAAFPPALKSAFREPLYIDLRLTGGWWRRSRRFREQSLRVIAALLEADFATVFREDERRSRRQRWTAAAVLLALGMTVGSAWLASKVPTDTWARVDVPGDYLGNRLLPIREYAVNEADVELRLFRAFGAEYAAQRPKNPIGVIGDAASAAWLQQFRDAALGQLRNADDPATSWRPLANFPFTVTHDLAAVGGEGGDSEPQHWGGGELYLHAFLPKPDGPPAFAWSMRYVGRNEAGATVRVTLPPTAAAHDDPFRLEPWPASELIRAGALPTWGFLRGELVARWSSTPHALSYRLVDAVEQFQEANDGMWIESMIATDGDPRREVTVGGQRIAIVDLEADAWAQVVADDTWMTPRAPRMQHISNLYIHRDEARKVDVRDAGKRITLDAAVQQLLERDLVFEPDLDHAVSHVARDNAGGRNEALTVVTRHYNERTRIAEHQKTSYFLRRKGQAWSRLAGLALQPGTAVIDVLPLDAGANRLLLLTDREGFQLTEDGGATWVDFNHNEPALRNGALVRTVIVSSPAEIYALVDHDNANQANPLFRHVRRKWNERLRIALIRLIQPSGQS